MNAAIKDLTHEIAARIADDTAAALKAKGINAKAPEVFPEFERVTIKAITGLVDIYRTIAACERYGTYTPEIAAYMRVDAAADVCGAAVKAIVAGVEKTK